jgi:hypothetical protein
VLDVSRHAYLCVALGPLAVVALATVGFEWVSPSGPDTRFAAVPYLSAPALAPLSAPAVFNEASARYAWLTTVLLNVVVSLLAVACFATVVRRTLARRHWRAAGVGAISLCAVGILGLVIATEVGSALSRLLYAFTYDALVASGRFSAFFLNRVFVMISIVNTLAVVAPVCALVACSGIVVSDRESREDLADLRLRTRSLRETVNAAGALLVTGILHMGAWLRWSAALVPEKSAREGIEQFVLAVTVFWGLTFSLMIVVAFLPSMMILRSRALAWHFASPDHRDEDPEKWLTRHGLKFSMGGQLPQVAVILAPLLAGPAASLFNSVAQTLP